MARAGFRAGIAAALLVAAGAAGWVVSDAEEYASPAEAPGLPGGAYAELDSGRTHYLEAGRGTPVLLVHGFAANLSIWHHNVAALQERFRVVALDLFGRGRSARSPAYRYDADLYDTQVLELVEALELSPAVVVGHSMGGAVALRFAARHPERVRALVLVNAAGLPFPPPLPARLVRTPVLGAVLARFGMSLVLRDNYRRMFHDDALADDAMRRRHELSASIAGYRHALRKTLQNMDLQGLEPQARRVQALGIPTLIVWGARDEILPTGVYARFQELLPDAALLALDDAGHTPQYEQPARFNAEVMRFAAARTAPRHPGQESHP